MRDIPKVFPMAWIGRIAVGALLLALLPACGKNKAVDVHEETAGGKNVIALPDEFAKDPSDVLREMLLSHGTRMGYNEQSGRIVVAGQQTLDDGFSQSLDEKVRFELAQIAFLDALSSLGKYQASASGASQIVQSAAPPVSPDITLLAPTVLAQAEGGTPYGMAVAVGWSVKTAEQAKSLLTGSGRTGQHAANMELLEKWLGDFEKSPSVELGPRILSSPDGIEWILGIVSSDLNDGSDGMGQIKADACHALECAFGGGVRSTAGLYSEEGDEAKGEEIHRTTLRGHGFSRRSESTLTPFTRTIVEMSVSLQPVLRIDPTSNLIEWREWERDNPVTGRRVRVMVAAVAAKDIHRFLVSPIR